MVLGLQNVFLGNDIQVFTHRLFGTLKGLVGAQRHGAAGIHQRVARDAGFFVVGTTEPTVDHHQTAAALDGALAVLFPHGDVAVDDVAGTRQAELRQNAAAGGLVVVPGIVGILDLLMGGGVCHIQPLEGGHSAAAEQR